jgi:hypothetical protein
MLGRREALSGSEVEVQEGRDRRRRVKVLSNEHIQSTLIMTLDKQTAGVPVCDILVIDCNIPCPRRRSRTLSLKHHQDSLVMKNVEDV